ncbi:hypothetical protein Acr_14g0007290 [Actinidia rufa]|uniref:Uncharacterized protein n=1 Tax=Actinidia rufa TaxID=165716 RepID=A0A7J0FR89_9ERIC|nr:hypothetical protein Acr_14g0007290 [Actinidia rufa]
MAISPELDGGMAKPVIWVRVLPNFLLVRYGYGKRTEIPDRITAVGSKPKHGKVPACLGNCKIAILSFLRSLTTLQAKKQRKTTTKKSREWESTATKMKSVMKKLRVQKKGAFLSKLLSALQKHR